MRLLLTNCNEKLSTNAGLFALGRDVQILCEVQHTALHVKFRGHEELTVSEINSHGQKPVIHEVPRKEWVEACRPRKLPPGRHAIACECLQVHIRTDQRYSVVLKREFHLFHPFLVLRARLRKARKAITGGTQQKTHHSVNVPLKYKILKKN